MKRLLLRVSEESLVPFTHLAARLTDDREVPAEIKGVREMVKIFQTTSRIF